MDQAEWHEIALRYVMHMHRHSCKHTHATLAHTCTRRYAVNRWLWPHIKKDPEEKLLWEMLEVGAKPNGQQGFISTAAGNARAMQHVVERYLQDVPHGSWRQGPWDTLYDMFQQRFLKNSVTKHVVDTFLRRHRRNKISKEKNQQGAIQRASSELLSWAREMKWEKNHSHRGWLFTKIMSKLGGQWTRMWHQLDGSQQTELIQLLTASGLSTNQWRQIERVTGCSRSEAELEVEHEVEPEALPDAKADAQVELIAAPGAAEALPAAPDAASNAKPEA